MFAHSIPIKARLIFINIALIWYYAYERVLCPWPQEQLIILEQAEEYQINSIT